MFWVNDYDVMNEFIVYLLKSIAKNYLNYISLYLSLFSVFFYFFFSETTNQNWADFLNRPS